MNLALLLAVLLASLPTPTVAQQCDDFDSCTMNDMCVGDECTGTPRTGGSCDDGDPCTINDNCSSGNCAGTPAPDGTECGGGCGMCQFGFCLPDITQNGQPCNDGFTCTTNDACQFGICFGTLRQCPDTDGNPCTGDFCNPETGQCQSTEFPPCLPCQTCRNTGGGFACDPAPDGMVCEDFNVCTPSSMCSDGECVGIFGGDPTPTATGVAPPTATVTPMQPTLTPTVGGLLCVGDCNLDGMVTVDEIVTAVNIALGQRLVGDCPSADGNLDGQVTVDEIVTAVNNALNGC
jgi:hypothetical protein